MERGKNEVTPEASKETGGRVSGQVCSNPQGRERASRPSYQVDRLVQIPSKVLSFVQLSPLINVIDV